MCGIAHEGGFAPAVAPSNMCLPIEHSIASNDLIRGISGSKV
jgi:hypothetical protein